MNDSDTSFQEFFGVTESEEEAFFEASELIASGEYGNIEQKD